MARKEAEAQEGGLPATEAQEGSALSPGPPFMPPTRGVGSVLRARKGEEYSENLFLELKV